MRLKPSAYISTSSHHHIITALRVETRQTASAGETRQAAAPGETRQAASVQGTLLKKITSHNK
jgi:hypothetical protein